MIGVMPGHALLGANCTATSMIGMIALARIIVRDSILLVDFVNLKVAEGMPLEQAVIQSTAARARPIALIFGILVSTVLTLIVIPVPYWATSRA